MYFNFQTLLIIFTFFLILLLLFFFFKKLKEKYVKMNEHTFISINSSVGRIYHHNYI